MKETRIVAFGVLSSVALIVGAAQPAASHPHVFIYAVVEVQFDTGGRLSGVHEIWMLDYDAGDIMKLEADRLGNSNGRTEPEELQLLLPNNKLSWISYANYFTRITVAGRQVEHLAPQMIDVRLERSRLAVEFTLPLAEPQVVTTNAGVDVFDGEFYYDFEFGPNPVRSAGVPQSCGVSRRSQDNIDPMAVMLLRRLGLTANPTILNDPAAGYAVRLQLDYAA